MHWFTVCLFGSWHFQVAAFNLDTNDVLRKTWRPEKPFWTLFGLPTAAHPCQKEPVSTKHPQCSLNTAMSCHLRCFCPNCWWELHKPNIRTRSFLLVLFTSVTLQQHLSAANPLSLIIKVCLHAVVTSYFCYIFVNDDR